MPKRASVFSSALLVRIRPDLLAIQLLCHQCQQLLQVLPGDLAVLAFTARFSHAAGQELIRHLPPVMLVNSWKEAEGSWLQSTLRYMAHEAQQLSPVGETVMSHLADILIVQVIRSWLNNAPQADTGWLAALRDKQIGRALAAIHRNPEENWTIDRLARMAAMSRSGFSTRFTEFMGEPAIRYLLRWRMQMARMQLEFSSEAMISIAEKLGHQSEAAFSRAFKRVFGVAPGRVRKDGMPWHWLSGDSIMLL